MASKSRRKPPTGTVVEVGWDAREVDLMARLLERAASETGDEVAHDTLKVILAAVPDHVPTYIHNSVRRMEVERESQGRLWGWRNER